MLIASVAKLPLILSHKKIVNTENAACAAFPSKLLSLLYFTLIKLILESFIDGFNENELK